MDADEWDRRYAESGLVWSAEPNRFVAAEFTDLPPGRALDLAAGEGRNAIWLADRGWATTAVDFSAAAIDKGRRLAEDRGVKVEWIVADLLDYRPRAEAFDAVLIAYFHVPAADLAAVLDRACAAVAPGGVLLVVGHDLTNIADGTGGPQNPDLLYTPDAITARLGPLHIERAEIARRPVATETGPRDALDTVVRARRASS